MSYSSTPNYALKKPNVNSDNDVWGDHWNQNADALDSIVHGIDTRAQVTSFNTRTGAVTLTAADVTAVGFATTTTNDASYVNASGDTMTGSLALSGNAVSALQAVPLQQLNAALPQPGSATPGMDSTGAAGTSTLYARQDHIHPTDTSRYAASNPSGYQTAAQVTTALAPYAPLASPALTGAPTGPTVTPATDSTTKLATTAFVQSVVGALPAYAPLNAPVFTGDARAVTPPPGDNDTSIATTAFVGNALGGYATTAVAANNTGRNLLHNGLFNVSQRGAGAFTQNYCLDRWSIATSTDTASVVQGAISDAQRTQIGDEAAQSALQNTFTGTSGAAAWTIIGQQIENVRRLAGKTVTISFWAIASATLKLGASLDQVFGFTGSPSPTVSVNGQSVTVTGTYARYSITLTLPSIIGKTVGTDGRDATVLYLWYSSGSTNNVRSGNVGVQSGTINVWGIQLEIGSVATPFDAGGTPADQLRQCQRFYCVGNSLRSTATSTTVSGWSDQITITFPVTMRAVPTMTSQQLSQTNCTGSVANSSTTNGFQHVLTTSGTSGTWLSQINWQASADL